MNSIKDIKLQKHPLKPINSISLNHELVSIIKRRQMELSTKHGEVIPLTYISSELMLYALKNFDIEDSVYFPDEPKNFDEVLD